MVQVGDGVILWMAQACCSKDNILGFVVLCLICIEFSQLKWFCHQRLWTQQGRSFCDTHITLCGREEVLEMAIGNLAKKDGGYYWQIEVDFVVAMKTFAWWVFQSRWWCLLGLFLQEMTKSVVEAKPNPMMRISTSLGEASRPL
jgi:hypothetical protein